jgi:D-3-phosphoglycerate dehydrogenase
MAIQSGHILGACLDVLEYEKSSFESFFDQKLDTDFQFLLESDKVVLTPHVGGWTHESYFKLSNVLGDKILSAFNT